MFTCFLKLPRKCSQLQFLETRKINIWKTKQIIKNGKEEREGRRERERDEKEKYLYIYITYIKQQIQIDEQIRTSVFRNTNLYTVCMYVVHALGSNEMQIIIYKHEYDKHVCVCSRAKKEHLVYSFAGDGIQIEKIQLWISFKIQTLCKQTDFVWV